MNSMNYSRGGHKASSLLLVVMLIMAALALPDTASAQRRRASRGRSRGAVVKRRAPQASSVARRTPRRTSIAARRRAARPLPVVRPLPPNVDPFTALERVGDQAQKWSLDFAQTPFDKKAQGSAEVALVGRTLLARVRASDLPVPSFFGVPRYSLWAYVPNYGVKIYIGDLPITPTSRKQERLAGQGGRSVTVVRGTSDSAYRFPALPPGANFGGLILTAEPMRFTPVINEALRPVLVALTEKPDDKFAAAPAVYSGTKYFTPNSRPIQ